ncbi:hypothetical protein EGJ13_20120 [Stutzerimonas stutzeri]|nr:hypothetical protein EGI94_14935 [Stutzerimonas stutzeri]RRV79309.1 hypothetical protein EGJ13_20120 [Stutzerimonas stutzeri]RRV88455.1 hypothetical protein EGJ21_19885 [Stutzerimonas stutzeri]RRV90449.1 hypothetical protein EGJ17_20100 [Stutzerimonas stutzeri]RRV93774.1 hypothetical protein EGJ14_20080 [Stutzerimonas stutzeri]
MFFRIKYSVSYLINSHAALCKGLTNILAHSVGQRLAGVNTNKTKPAILGNITYGYLSKNPFSKVWGPVVKKPIDNDNVASDRRVKDSFYNSFFVKGIILWENKGACQSVFCESIRNFSNIQLVRVF